jgi:hypothetical protein
VRLGKKPGTLGCPGARVAYSACTLPSVHRERLVCIRPEAAAQSLGALHPFTTAKPKNGACPHGSTVLGIVATSGP